MSTVQYTQPRLRLAALLRVPGGPPVDEALAAADEGLRTLAPDGRAELDLQLLRAEAAFATLGGCADDAALGLIYEAAVSAIGLGELTGEGALDLALTSLCDLIDDLRTQQRLDADAVDVHLKAWRLLLAGEARPAASATMIEGLVKVSARFAAP